MRAVMAALGGGKAGGRAPRARSVGGASSAAVQQHLQGERRMDGLELRIAEVEKRLHSIAQHIPDLEAMQKDVDVLRRLCLPSPSQLVSQDTADPAVAAERPSKVQRTENKQSVGSKEKTVIPDQQKKKNETLRADQVDGCTDEVSDGLLLGRYRVLDHPPLGSGGWCIVRKAEDLHGEKVALKSYNSQAVRQVDSQALIERFRREVRTFQALDIGPSTPSSSSTSQGESRSVLVNLLDFSCEGGNKAAGPAADGNCYTVLELAEESLDAFLERRAASGDYVVIDDLRKVSDALISGLHCIHSRGLCHLDVKPENMMRFQGGRWKLIDLEGCQPSDEGRLKSDSFTPLYASPELARFALDGAESAGIAPTPAMDIWSAGVVVLDMLAHKAAFAETKAGTACASLFEEECVPCQGWYEWLADPEPLNIESFIDTPASVQLLKGSPDLQDFLGQLLEKDSSRRPSAEGLKRHPFLQASR
eukprot:TRINITY_DN27162_c0_g1_i1.p1 TRINITY_DN27162_c0_g1~~TRINITY_DN27162_c0_g1_i1.p1  ORF type:complete len:497 (+),score=115.29 TRINITY_DN27162_c0_g1_i1:61-1491(+)